MGYGARPITSPSSNERKRWNITITSTLSHDLFRMFVNLTVEPRENESEISGRCKRNFFLAYRIIVICRYCNLLMTICRVRSGSLPKFKNYYLPQRPHIFGIHYKSHRQPFRVIMSILWKQNLCRSSGCNYERLKACSQHTNWTELNSRSHIPVHFSSGTVDGP